MNKLPGIFMVLFFTLSCFQNSKDKLPEQLNQFEGTWQLDNSNTYEIWEDKGTFFEGRVTKIEKQDTFLVENLRILSIKNDIFYEATVPSQNQGESILFKLTEKSTSHFLFENPEHDFPKKIQYNFHEKDRLTATISGNNKRASFNYQKIK